MNEYNITPGTPATRSKQSLIRGLYEHLVSGLLPERQYRQLMQQYDISNQETNDGVAAVKEYGVCSLAKFAGFTVEKNSVLWYY